MTASSPRLWRAVLFVAAAAWCAGAEAFACKDLWWGWLQYQCSGFGDAYDHGGADLYLTGWTHHDRHTYSPEKIAEFNEEAWGGGFGTGLRNDRGDDFGWYALAFRDSHYNITAMAGWSWMTYWPARSDYAAGLGYTAFVATRPDIWEGIPFPGILPLAGVRLSRVEIMGTYIPKVSQGTTGNGNVGFVFMRIHF